MVVVEGLVRIRQNNRSVRLQKRSAGIRPQVSIKISGVVAANMAGKVFLAGRLPDV